VWGHNTDCLTSGSERLETRKPEPWDRIKRTSTGTGSDMTRTSLSDIRSTSVSHLDEQLISTNGHKLLTHHQSWAKNKSHLYHKRRTLESGRAGRETKAPDIRQGNITWSSCHNKSTKDMGILWLGKKWLVKQDLTGLTWNHSHIDLSLSAPVHWSPGTDDWRHRSGSVHHRLKLGITAGEPVSESLI
jgi:hypothetical protein